MIDDPGDDEDFPEDDDSGDDGPGDGAGVDSDRRTDKERPRDGNRPGKGVGRLFKERPAGFEGVLSPLAPLPENLGEQSALESPAAPDGSAAPVEVTHSADDGVPLGGIRTLLGGVLMLLLGGGFLLWRNRSKRYLSA